MIEIIPNWHPIFVHFTVALLTTATLLFLVAAIARSQPWADAVLTTAHWNLWLGAALTVLTVAAGFYAYNTVTHDDPSHAAMTDHRNWAVGTALLFWALALYAAWWRRRYGTLNSAFVAITIVASGLLATTAWKGGELVYRHGLGVLSLPQAEGEGHAHEAGSDHDHDAQTPGAHDEADSGDHEH